MIKIDKKYKILLKWKKTVKKLQTVKCGKKNEKAINY